MASRLKNIFSKSGSSVVGNAENATPTTTATQQQVETAEPPYDLSQAPRFLIESQTAIKESGGIDGVLICTLDETHAEIATSLIPLGWHVLVEKPLATTYEDCLKIQVAVEKANCIFAIGHVLRYSPHNRLLHRLLTEDKIVGEIVAIEHKEPVGWYHFSHSFVRGNWHNEAESGPSILTKCCHDLDLLLWLLCSPKPFDPDAPSTSPHPPTSVYSTGHLSHFRKRNKPKNASNNCITCPESVERSCMYSAKKIYLENPSGMRGGYNTEWPVNIVYPEVEDDPGNFESKEKELLRRLAEGPYGRCVYDGHNDVIDNQVVVMSWDGDNEDPTDEEPAGVPRNPKTATLTMTAFSQAICERKTVIYGTKGELHSDTSWPNASASAEKRPMREPQTSLHSISFTDPYAQWVTHTPEPGDRFSGHGGGDTGLAQAFVSAVEAVKIFGCDVGKAQREHIGAGIDEAIRAHGMAWCAEESRKSSERKDWSMWDAQQRQNISPFKENHDVVDAAL
ncbi:hypothetical protein ABW20_dc0109303 [Dactylellina cionopaga]|nr:hypothetical protein ABW20_dc0109303 [Dactylellina cionopaga]